jgi:hypothetical protein
MLRDMTAQSFNTICSGLYDRSSIHVISYHNNTDFGSHLASYMSGEKNFLSRGKLKWPEHEAGHSSLFVAEAQNVRNPTFTCPTRIRNFVLKQRGKFNLP